MGRALICWLGDMGSNPVQHNNQGLKEPGKIIRRLCYCWPYLLHPFLSMEWNVPCRRNLNGGLLRLFYGGGDCYKPTVIRFLPLQWPFLKKKIHFVRLLFCGKGKHIEVSIRSAQLRKKLAELWQKRAPILTVNYLSSRKRFPCLHSLI